MRDQVAPVALVLGVALLVTAVAGLAGWWWAAAAAGVALVAFAVFDERGRTAGDEVTARRRAHDRRGPA